jgi:ankyrin repeat protein
MDSSSLAPLFNLVHTNDNLALRASNGTLTVQDVVAADKFKLMIDEYLGGSVFHWACYTGPIAIVDAILARKDLTIDLLNALDEQLDTPLICAALNLQEDIMLLLIQRGTNVCLVDVHGSSAIHYAAYRGLSQSVIDALIAAGADAQLKNKQGYTPAHMARMKGHTTIATYLDGLT